MSHDIGDPCCKVCENCGVVFCTGAIKICPLCGTVPWIFDEGAAKRDFDEWLEHKLQELKEARIAREKK